MEPRTQRPWQAIFGNSAWYLGEKAIRLGGSLVLTLWIAHHLGPVSYATLALGLALVSLLGFLGSLGMESVVLRDLVQQPGRASAIVSTYFLIRLTGALTVPVLAAAYVLVSHPGDTSTLLVAVILSASPVFMSLDVVDTFLQARQQARRTSLIRMLAFVAASLVKVALVLGGAQVLWFACAQVLELALVAMAYAHTIRQCGLRVAPSEFNRGDARAYLIGGQSMIFSGLTVAIYSKIDILVVGQLLPKEVLASYAVAASMCAAWNVVGMSVSQAFAPHLSGARAADKGAYLSLMRRFLALMLALSVSGSMLLAMIAPWIFNLLLGQPYAEVPRVFGILVWSSVPVFLGVATSQIIVNERLYRYSLLRTTLGMTCTLAFIVPAALGDGAMGVAWLIVLSACVATGAILLSSVARSQIVELLWPGANQKAL